MTKYQSYCLNVLVYSLSEAPSSELNSSVYFGRLATVLAAITRTLERVGGASSFIALAVRFEAVRPRPLDDFDPRSSSSSLVAMDETESLDDVELRELRALTGRLSVSL